MRDRILRLDPALPLCWEDHQTLRLGFDRAEARLVHPSAAAQRILARLQNGVRAPLLSRELERAGCSPAEWLALSEALGPALRTAETGDPSDHSPRAFRPRIGILGPGGERTGAVATVLREAMGRAGFHAEPFSERGTVHDLVVVAERYLEPVGPARLAATGLPQLGLRFGDRGFRIGPLATGDGRPCLSCIALHDIDADPALPVLSAQLLDRRPASETEAGLEAAAALAVTMARHWAAGSTALSRRRLHVPVHDGLPALAPRSEPVSAHPDCGCAELAADRQTMRDAA